MYYYIGHIIQPLAYFKAYISMVCIVFKLQQYTP
nr:MAG TPA: hypothetical protein [Caudoviricetes sp.]